MALKVIQNDLGYLVVGVVVLVGPVHANAVAIEGVAVAEGVAAVHTHWYTVS